jgi:hypothetical protein
MEIRGHCPNCNELTIFEKEEDDKDPKILKGKKDKNPKVHPIVVITCKCGADIHIKM